MTTTTAVGDYDQTGRRDDLFHSLTRRRNRLTIGCLLEQNRSELSIRALAERLAALEGEQTDESASDVRRIRLELVHDTLPALADSELLAWDRTDGTVRLGSNPVLTRPVIRQYLRESYTGNEPSTTADRDRLFEALSNDRRRRIVVELMHRRGSVSRGRLARHVAAREIEADPESVDGSHVDRVLASLVHTHLPLLADSGLVEYRHGLGRVRYAHERPVAEEWLQAGFQGTSPFLA